MHNKRPFWEKNLSDDDFSKGDYSSGLILVPQLRNWPNQSLHFNIWFSFGPFVELALHVVHVNMLSQQWPVRTSTVGTCKKTQIALSFSFLSTPADSKDLRWDWVSLAELILADERRQVTAREVRKGVISSLHACWWGKKLSWLTSVVYLCSHMCRITFELGIEIQGLTCLFHSSNTKMCPSA